MSAPTTTSSGRAAADATRHHRGSLRRDTPIIVQRNLRRTLRQPQIAVFVLIQPIMFVLLFRYVFGSAIPIPGFEYVQYLMPGIIAQTLVFGSASTAIAITEDLKAGISDRFRALPMSGAAVTTGQVGSSLVVNLVSVFVMLAVGYLVGFRITTNVGEALLALALLLALTVAFSFISATIGLAVREPEAAQSAGFIWLFPLTFVSSVFVPTSGMPTVLKFFAEKINPITHAANASRALTIDGYLCPGLDQAAFASAMAPGGDLSGIVCSDPTSPALWTLLWVAGLVAVFLPLSMRLWGRLE